MDTEKHTLAVSQINFVRMAVAADIQIRFTAHGGHTVMRLQLLAGGWLDDHQAIARLRAALDRLSAPELEALYAFLQTPEYESPDDVNDKRRRDRCEHGRRIMKRVITRCHANLELNDAEPLLAIRLDGVVIHD